jgi:hypothetical protein
LVGFISIFTNFNTGGSKDTIGYISRKYFYLVSSLMLFLSIKNIPLYDNELLRNFANKALDLILILIATHILIAVLVKYIPQMGSIFSIFLTREYNTFDSVNREKMARISSFVFTPESFGEIIAVVCPLLFYKLYKNKIGVWLIITLIYLTGLIYTVTRSGILLFSLGIIGSMLFRSSTKISKNMIIVYALAFMMFSFYFLNQSVFSDLYIRFKAIDASYQSGGNIFEIINRGGFLETLKLVFGNVSFFGHGITDYNFHNLYLTIFHSRGIFGFILYFTILFFPSFSLYKVFKNNRCADRDLIFACLLSYTIFAINEFKYEFNRSSSYQQLCWALFSVYFLLSKNKSETFIYDKSYVYKW